jgi:hypothetical protein
MATRRSKRIARKMATLEERGASDSSVQPEGYLAAEVTETAAAATLSAADGPDEAAVDVCQITALAIHLISSGPLLTILA